MWPSKPASCDDVASIRSPCSVPFSVEMLTLECSIAQVKSVPMLSSGEHVWGVEVITMPMNDAPLGWSILLEPEKSSVPAVPVPQRTTLVGTGFDPKAAIPPNTRTAAAAGAAVRRVHLRFILVPSCVRPGCPARLRYRHPPLRRRLRRFLATPAKVDREGVRGAGCGGASDLPAPPLR